MPECLSPLLNVEIADLGVSQASNIVLGSDGRSKLDHLLPAHSPQTKKLRKLKSWSEIKRVMEEAREAELFRICALCEITHTAA